MASWSSSFKRFAKFGRQASQSVSRLFPTAPNLSPPVVSESKAKEATMALLNYLFTNHKASFLKFNDLFTRLTLHWASLYDEFDLPLGNVWIVADRVTIGWSIVIVLTHLVKFITVEESLRLFESNNGSGELSIRDLLLINYLPYATEFVKMYYFLMGVAVGAPLIWRLYLMLFRPKALVNSNPNLTAKRDLVLFFLNGPSCAEGAAAAAAEPFDPDYSAVGARLASWTLERDFVPCRHGHFLSQVHLNRARRYEQFLEWQRLEEEEDFVNPIRAAKFFNDNSEERWLFLAQYVYTFFFSAVVLSTIIGWYVMIGLGKISDAFGVRDQSATVMFLIHSYLALEQIYACLQINIFYVIMNIYLTLFYADLVYKFDPICSQVRDLAQIYRMRPLDEQQQLRARGEIRKVQDSIWAFFDTVDQLDSLVSKYSVLATATFVVQLIIGYSYIQISDQVVRNGTYAAFIANLLSFSYPHFLFWGILERVSVAAHSIRPALASQPLSATN